MSAIDPQHAAANEAGFSARAKGASDPAPINIIGHKGDLKFDNWPHGWNAVRFGVQLGFGFVAGALVMICIAIGLTKLPSLVLS